MEVIPPPFKKITEPLTEDNENIPGDIVVSETGELLKSYFIFSGFIDDIIETFDDWIFDKIPKQLAARNIELDNGKKVFLENPHVSPPIYSIGAKSYPMLPAIARARKDTYSGVLTVDLVIRNPDGSIYDKEENVSLGRIPIMLRSQLCYLHGKTSEELIRMGECVGDPFGYFIIRGLEYFVMTQEKLRVNKVILFNKDTQGTSACRMTCYTIKGTNVVMITMSEIKGLRLSLHFLKDKTISVFQVFRIFGIKDEKVIEEMVLLFTRKEWRTKVSYFLQPTFIEYYRVSDDSDDISAKLGETWTLDRIKAKLMEELFPQMNGTGNTMNRLWLLAMMIARYAEYIAGLRSLDDRDHWQIKRLESAGRSFEQLFNQILNVYIFRELAENIQKKGLRKASDMARSINKGRMTETFIKSFNPKSWGVKGNFNKENVAEQMKRENTLNVFSQLLRINTPASRQAKQPHIRMVQMSQLGYIDPVETPEGKNCGLVKHRSITCRYSIERDDTIIKKYLEPFLSPQYVELKYRTATLLNGKFLGWCSGDETYRTLRSMKLKKEIYFDSCIVYDRDDEILYVHTDGARAIRPLLVVSDNELVIDKKNLWGKSFQELMDHGAVEYVDAWEQEYALVSQSIHDLRYHKESIRQALVTVEKYRNEWEQTKKPEFESLYRTALHAYERLRKKQYTHCELDPTAILGTLSSLMPLANHNQGPRISYFCSMIKQALSQYHNNHQLRFDPTIKVLAWPTRPIFETQMSKFLPLDPLPSGETVICAFMTYTGYNQEDSLIFNKNSVDAGKFMYTVYHKYQTVVKSGEREFMEYLGLSDKEEEKAKQVNLDEHGIVKLGTYVKNDDILVRKIRIYTGESKKKQEEKIIDLKVAKYHSGIVDQILVCRNIENKETVYIKIRDVRKPERGDKFASRYAQKATIGVILPVEDMPFVVEGRDSGVVPDVIVNPHSIISRMTMGKMLEIVTSKVAALRGERINATAFQKFDLDHFQRILKQYGYDENGVETMRSGFTGELIKAKIFMGPCYYMAMRHHVKEKIQMRARGAVKAITHQPISGRNRGGGLRFGEMEKDNLVSHGASALIQERLKFSSDVFQAVFCKRCGQIAISNIQEGKVKCRKCLQQASFGRCVIPYAFKTLLHYFAGVGIVMALKFKETEELGRYEYQPTATEVVPEFQEEREEE